VNDFEGRLTTSKMAPFHRPCCNLLRVSVVTTTLSRLVSTMLLVQCTWLTVTLKKSFNFYKSATGHVRFLICL